MNNGVVVVLTIASMIILSAMTILAIKELKRRRLQEMDHFLFIDQEKIFPIRVKERQEITLNCVQGIYRQFPLRAHFKKYLRKSCHALKFSPQGSEFMTSKVHRKSLKKVRHKFQNKNFTVRTFFKINSSILLACQSQIRKSKTFLRL